VQYKSEY
jgi:peroxisome-assembly ATPase